MFNPLPPLKVIEELDFETLLKSRKERFIDLFKTRDEKALWTKRLELESEPVTKLLEENAYLEMLVRSRINDSVKACLLPHATGTDLDNLATFYHLKRHVIDEGDPSAKPPRPKVMEDDEHFRQRLYLSFDRLNTAGSKNAYKAFALGVDGRIKDAFIFSPAGGIVDVYLLFEKGTKSHVQEELQQKVQAFLSAEDIRPLCDNVTVKIASVKKYNIEATLQVFNLHEKAEIEKRAKESVNDFCTHARRFGFDITTSAIIKALFVQGVQNVQLKSPLDTIAVAQHEVAELERIQLTIKGQEDYEG